ncbi:hypothetical protein ACJJIQ_16570 [Microbulbifer sp. ANSA003]
MSEKQEVKSLQEAKERLRALVTPEKLAIRPKPVDSATKQRPQDA